MDFNVLLVGSDRLEVTDEAGRRYTFPLDELQATRRRPRFEQQATDLPVNSPLRVLEEARRAAEEYAILNDLI